MKTTASAIIFALLSASALVAAEPKITKVTVTPTGMGWDFAVTIAHPDTGWDHFADGWEIVDEAGHVYGHRKLHHPHVDEQPFTRTLRNVMLPDGTRKVFIRVRCSADGWKEGLYEVSVSR